MTIPEIIHRLQDPSLPQTTREGLMQYPGANPADIDKVLKWTLALRDDLVTLVKEIDDPDEVRMSLAINYIELKSRWIAMNTKINYQNFRTGSCDVLTVIRGSAISQVLGLVEGLLTQEDIDQITQFLAEPVRRAA